MKKPELKVGRVQVDRRDGLITPDEKKFLPNLIVGKRQLLVALPRYFTWIRTMIF